MKAFLVLFASLLCWSLGAAPVRAINPAPLPPDDELKKLIVGTWKVDLAATSSSARSAYEVYSANGTFKVFVVVREGSAPAKSLVEASGTWNVQDGFLITKVRASNLSATTGRIYRDKIESATRGWFIAREAERSHTRRRAQLPSDLEPRGDEVPKVFTVEEAARVLRHAVKPEYSYEARRLKATGTGIFELRFDYESGRLKAIDIVQSTGNRVLDHDAINGLKEWRAKPHSIRVMRIPVTFTSR